MLPNYRLWFVLVFFAHGAIGQCLEPDSDVLETIRNENHTDLPHLPRR